MRIRWRTTIASFSATTASLRTAPTARMAEPGGLMMAVNSSMPDDAEVADGEGGPRVLLRRELARARPLDEVGELRVDGDDPLAAAVAHHGRDQAVRQRHREPDVGRGVAEERVPVPGRVDLRVTRQRPARRSP